MNKFTEYSIEAERMVSALDAAQFYGLEMSLKGFASCPFHIERTASFYAKGSYFYCYGCGWHGNVVEFVKDYFNLSFIDALKKVNADFMLGFPLERKLTFDERRSIEQKRAERDLIRSFESAQKRALQSLLDEWIKLDRIIIEQEPKPYDPVPDQYATALKRIDYIADLLDSYEAKQGRGCCVG